MLGISVVADWRSVNGILQFGMCLLGTGCVCVSNLQGSFRLLDLKQKCIFLDYIVTVTLQLYLTQCEAKLSTMLLWHPFKDA